MNVHFIAVVLVGCFLCVTSSEDECERDKCRTVRNVIYQDIIGMFREVGAKIPYKCPFYKDRDSYIAQEDHKERESSTRWSCSYCGKSFIGERYLDMHFSNRHDKTIYKEPDSICLADYCEIFRCDVLSGVAKPTFWDLALCMEDDMQDLSQDCMELLTGCIPESLNWNSSKSLTNKLNEGICSFLTCKKYYDAPLIQQEEEPPGPAYVVFTVLLSVAMIIYYCVAINYFWTDSFSDVYDSDEYVGKHPESLFSSEPAPKPNTRKHNTYHSHRKQTNLPRPNFIQTETQRDDIFNVSARLDESMQNNPNTAVDDSS